MKFTRKLGFATSAFRTTEDWSADWSRGGVGAAVSAAERGAVRSDWALVQGSS